MATSFRECIAIDLKFYEGRILLHLIDHATRLSVSSFVKSKEPEVIHKAIFKLWVQIYGQPETFLTDNGRQFANSKFIDMTESRVSHSEGGEAWVAHPTIFFATPPPPIKIDGPPWGAPLHFKMKPPHLKNNLPSPPLKREAPFHEMILRKSTINNNLKSS